MADSVLTISLTSSETKVLREAMNSIRSWLADAIGTIDASPGNYHFSGTANEAGVLFFAVTDLQPKLSGQDYAAAQALLDQLGKAVPNDGGDGGSAIKVGQP